ncbi:MutS-related protein [Nonlabens xiamenensis]|uniref:MutS-related protein n=1 Tax=Nonlabens xiamenensis TaxID=2341043 RepID=UPI000F60A131|nr:DNA mismatch repair protein MutS [Nonlabens xiamenensis]
MTSDLHSFYLNRRDQYHEHLIQLQNRLRWSSTIRLGVFLLGILGVYLLWSYWQFAVFLALCSFAGFLYLVSRHEDLKKQKAFAAALQEQNELEIQILDRNFHHLPDGREFLEDQHEYSRDIDLFGKGSLFQYLNRSKTTAGVATLSRKLTSNHTEHIPEKQQAVDELAGKVDFRQKFWATASLMDQTQNPNSLLDELLNYKSFVPTIFDWFGWVWFGLAVATGTCYALDLISGYIFAGVFFGGLAITGRYLKRINAFSTKIGDLESFFGQYGQLILAIEKEEFHTQQLKNLQHMILTDGLAASDRLFRLSKAISRLDQRNNLLFGTLANGLGLWDLKQVYCIESWIQDNAEHIADWMEVVSEIDALSSLANFAFNHPAYVFPTIQPGEFQLNALQAHHPLLDPAKSVGNNIRIKAGEFFIITGANMAGKSTFLRTVSMQILMANLGLPVAAKSCAYAPIKLITSMRTSDSLTDEASYFFSELTRLKYIVDKMEADRYFIVLDEILKGTNSQDKANGSRKLIQKLSQKKATGIIATHDLSLTQVADEYTSISNYYFDADITDDELTFDYTFKEGVATNMNASFLLRKMGIVDED